MLGFILSLFGILFLLVIAFLIGMVVMVYLLTEVIAKVPVDEYIEMFEELKELDGWTLSLDKKELSKEKNIFTGKCQVPRSQETESNNYFLMEDRVLCML